MGIVYEANQVSLHRHVALKVISPVISSSPKQLARFKREAATAARLHHTNIVPVFGSGEEAGIHYYAMQLIDGIPLHEAVRSLRNSGSFDFASTATTFFSQADAHSFNSNQTQPAESPGAPPTQVASVATLSDSPGSTIQKTALSSS